MNQQRRKTIEALKQRICDVKLELEGVRDEEQDAFDALPESVQNGERGEKMGAAVEALTDSCDSLDQIMSDLDVAME